MRDRARAWTLGFLAASPAVNAFLTNICYHSPREGGGGGGESSRFLIQILLKFPEGKSLEIQAVNGLEGVCDYCVASIAHP
jgi:hypothetical protein